jgi:hypothetical protein
MFKRFLLIIICLAAPAVFAQDDISIAMALSRDVITVDDQVILMITLIGSRQNLPEPQLPNLSMFEAYSQGTSTNISIVNGKMETSVAYNYILQPKREGTFVIKPAAITYDHKRIESNEVTLRVEASGSAAPSAPDRESAADQGELRDIYLTAEVDKKGAYVNEQITLTVKFYHSVRLYSQPDYTAPQTTGFWADILEPQRVYNQIINGRQYKIIEINTALFPTRSGELTIGPAMVSVEVPTQRRARRNDPFSVFDDFFGRGESKTVRSKRLTLNVLPLPEAGKPDDFSGTVGNYKISSYADKRTVEVNQPVTVTYKISGTGNIKTVAEPSIGDLMDFRVYRASSSEKVSKVNGVVGGIKVFEEVYIPKRAGKLAIPSVKLDFFDPAAKKYKTLTTEPVVLDVRPAPEGEFAELPFAPVSGRVVDPNAKDIRYIKMDAGDITRKQPLILFRPGYLILNGLPVLILVIAWASHRRKEKLTSDIGYARSRRARKMARKRLGRARKLTSQVPAEFYAEIRLALFSYVADKLNISPFGLTGDKLLDIIQKAGADENLINDTREILKRADFAQYSSAEVSREQITESLQLAEQVLVKLDEVEIA